MIFNRYKIDSKGYFIAVRALIQYKDVILPV